MPVDHRLKKEAVVYQRDVYAKSRLTRVFRDYLDNFALRALKDAKDILDIGCGEGLLLEKICIAKKDARVCGVDLCPENVEICRRYGLPVISADAQNLPFADGAFDVCVMTEVIEHLDKGGPQRLIREIARVLKSQGKIFIMLPNDTNYKLARLLTFKIREAFYDMGHTRQWTPAEAARLLKDAAFVIDKSFSVPLGLWQFSLNHILIGSKN